MDKVLDWSALQEEEGKFALGYVLVEELKGQMLVKGRDKHLGVSVFIDIDGQLKIAPQECPLPSNFKEKSLEDKLKLLLEAKLPEEDIMSLLAG